MLRKETHSLMENYYSKISQFNDLMCNELGVTYATQKCIIIILISTLIQSLPRMDLAHPSIPNQHHRQESTSDIMLLPS